jgi:hypothetical protein
VGTNQVAHAGRLFFNPNADSNASLFFPAAGDRNGSNGQLQLAGTGYYWTRSASSVSAASYFAIDPSLAYINTLKVSKSYALNVRCIKEESGIKVTPDGNWDSNSPGLGLGY